MRFSSTQLPHYTQGASALKQLKEWILYKNYIKLYNNKRTKNLGEDQMK